MKSKIFLLFFLAIFLIGNVTALWWNPFTWGTGEVVEKEVEGVWIEIFSDNPDMYTIIPEKGKHNADIYLCSKSATKKSDLKDLDFATSDWINGKNKETKEKLKPLEYEGQYCYYYKPSGNEKFLKFDKHSTHLIFTNESITAYDDTAFFNDNYVEIGRLSLTTEDFKYKNGIPNIELGVGKQLLTHTFYIENYSSNSITNLRVFDMDSKLELERNVNLKYLDYKDVEVLDYEEVCVYNETNSSESCSKEINGTKTIQQEDWKDMSLAVEGNNYVVGVFADTSEGDYVDIDFDYYGTSVLESPINWATWNASLDTDLIMYLKMDESSGTTVIDELGNYEGTATGATPNKGGIINTGWAFDGTDDEILLNDTVTPQGAKSISIWFNSSGDAFIYGNTFSSAVEGLFIRTTSGNLNTRLYIGGGGQYWDFNTAGTNYNDGDLHHLVLAWDGTTTADAVKHYIDGGIVQTATASGTEATPPSINLYLGESPTDIGDLTGNIDEVGVWSRQLNSGEAEMLYNSGSGLPYGSVIDNPPVITGELPANNSLYTTTTTVKINATVYDDINLDSVIWNVDGVNVSTNSSGTNNTLYKYQASYSTGNHTWYMIALDNESQRTDTDIYNFSIDISTPVITLQSPPDSSTQKNLTQEFIAYVESELTITNVSLYINGTLNETDSSGTNATNYSFTKTLEDGSYTWYVRSCNNMGFCADSLTWSLTIDTSPFIEFIGSTIANGTLSTSTSAYAEVNVSSLYFANVTFDLYNTTGLYNSQSYSDSTRNYTFTSLIDGTYYLNATSCATTGSCNNTETREFSVDTTAPTINITSPIDLDYLVNGTELLLNFTVTDLSLDSCWYTYGEDLQTNVSNNLLDENYSTSQELESGGSYVVIIEDLNKNITINYTSTAGGIVSNISEEIDTSSCTNRTITMNVSDLGAGFNDDASLYCGGIYLGDVIASGAFSDIAWRDIFNVMQGYTEEVNCTSGVLNSISFNYSLSDNNITVFAIDSFGNLNSSSVEWIAKVTENSQTYNTSTIGGALEDFSANLTLGTGYEITSATFNYNGTSETGSIIASGSTRIIGVSDLFIPVVTSDINQSFYWTVVLDDGTEINLSSNNQTVLALNLDDCSAYSFQLFNLSLFDEELLTPINGDIEMYYEVKNKPDYTTIQNLTGDFDNVSNTLVCSAINLTGQNLAYSVEIRYSSVNLTDNKTYVPELYHIQRADISGSQDISLYDLNIQDSTEFKIEYQDSNLLKVEGAIIQLQRKYIAENLYRTVEAPITSNEGTAILHIDLDTNKYKATVVKNGVVLDIFDNIVFVCDNELSGQCEQNLYGELDPDNEQDIETVRDFAYSISSSNQTVSLTYSVPSGVPGTINMVLEQKDQFGNTTICNQTVISSSGSFDCTYDDTIGDSYLTMVIYKNGIPLAIKSYLIPEAGAVDFLDNNFFIVLIFLLSLIGMAFTSPEWIVLNSVITILIAGSLYLLNGLNFVMGLGGLFWLFLASAILILKLSKQEDR